MDDTARRRSARATWIMRVPFLVAAAVAMLLALTGPATAGTQAVKGRSDITIQASGCSVRACLYVQAVGNGVSVWGKYAPLRNDPNWIYGHFHFWGPGYDRNTPDHAIDGWVDDDYSYWFGAHGTHCMELWQHLGNGTYRSWGRPCVNG